MATRPISWCSLLAPERIIFATVVALLFLSFTSGGHSHDVSGVSRADDTSGIRGAQTQTWGISKDSDVRRDRSKPELAIEAVRPIPAASDEIPAREDLAQDNIQVRLGDLVAYSGKGLGNGSSTISTRSFTPTSTPTKVPTFATGTPTPTTQSNSSGGTQARSLSGTRLVVSDKVYGPVQDGPTTEPEQPPTAPPLDDITPLIPNSTPTIYVTSVNGRFFYNPSGSYTFNVGTQTPPAFTQQFPLINFNPPAGYTCNGTPVGPSTIPLTDVDESNPCALIVAQATAPAPTPTLLQAGVPPLAGYQAVLLTNLYVSEAADITFFVSADDGFIWGIGPLNGIPGNPQPYRLDGVFTPGPPPSPTPYPTTTFGNYLVVGQRNGGSPVWGGGYVTVRFTQAGFYPIEMDNAEDGNPGANELYIALEMPSKTPVLNGPSATPTPTFTPTVICSSDSQWCTDLSPNSTGENVLNGAVALAQNRVWAVGGFNLTPTPRSGQPLIEQWNGTAWSTVTSLPTVGILNGVAASSASDVWAVGDDGILHNDGTTWSQVSAPNGANGVAVHTSSDAWAVGNTNILHYDGSSWTVSTPVPTSSALYGVAVIVSSALPQTHVWAVGTSNSASALIMHKVNSGNWTTVSNPAPIGSTSAVLNSIDWYHTNVIWAVGSYTLSNGYQKTLIEYYDYDGNGTWQIVPSPNPSATFNELRHVWVDQEGEVWAVGRYLDFFSNYKTLLAHWNGEQWDQIESPDPGIESQLIGVTSSTGVPSSNTPIITTVWAVGSYVPFLGSPYQTLVEHLAAPGHTAKSTSYYEQTNSASTHKTEGCNAAHNAESGGIILDYGRPRNLGTSSNPIYGATTIFSHVDIPITSSTQISITGLVEDFIYGYESCGGGGGSRFITVSPAINNDSSFGDLELTAPHAEEWANMTIALQDYVRSQHYDDVYIGAAIDAEPGFGGAESAVEAWETSYTTNAYSGLYNFGSTDTYPCPTTFPPPDACDPTGWTVDQFYNISWGIPGTFAMPQIYKPIHARWWYIVKRRAYDNHGEYMGFLGSWCCSSQVGKTEQAWQLLWLELNADPITRQDIYWVTANKQQ